MLFKLNKSGPWSICKKHAGGAVVLLVPGTNDISKQDWEEIKDNPSVKEKLQKGTLVKVGAPEENKDQDSGQGDSGGQGDDMSGAEFSALGASDAKELVKETYNIKLLRDWKEEETRSTVRKAIDEQIEVIEEERDIDDEGGDE